MNSTLLLATLNLALGGLVFLLGFVILRENRTSRLNRVVALMLFCGGLGAVFGALGMLAGRAGVPGRVPGRILENIAYVWEFFFPALFVFASLFPRERAFTRRIQLPLTPWFSLGFGTLVYAPHIFHFALMVLLLVWRPDIPVPEQGLLRYAAPAISVFGVVVRLFLLVHQALFSLVNLGFGIGAILLLSDSTRAAVVPRLRRQLQVLTIGLTACLVCYGVSTSIPQLLAIPVSEAWRAGFGIAALVLGPGSIAYAIVAHKFLDARLLARRAILYALGSAALVGLYLVVLTPVNRLLRAVPGVEPRVFEPVLLVMALVLFQPAVARLEEILDRMLLRDPSDYRNVLRQLGRDLQTTIDLDELLGRTARTLSEALLLRTGHVVAVAGPQLVVMTGAGVPPDPAMLARLRAILPQVSSRQTSFRLADRVEGLSREDQQVLTGPLGLSLLVPLRWRGDLVGAFLLGEKVTGTDYTSEDVSLLTALASQVSVSLQNALLLRDRLQVARFEQELDLARQIQRTSLLSEFPALPRCEIHAVYIPSRQVGGDFYDVVPAGDGSHLIAIADVSGKGVPAALLSSMLQASLRTQSGAAASPDAILRNINSLLYRSTALHQFATFFLARVDGERLHLRFSNAGHNWPVVVRSSGEHVFLQEGGAPLGILEQAAFQEGEITLAPGDRMVLYTDGISEATDAAGEQFGEQRLCDLIHRLPAGLAAAGVAEAIIENLRGFLGEVEPQDDITLLVVRVFETSAAPPGQDGRPAEVAAAPA